MSDDRTFEDVLMAIQAWIQQTWQSIYETIVKPLRRWFCSINWMLLDKKLRRIAHLIGARRPRPRNSRVRMVQATRARLMLPPSGKYAGLSKRESYAVAKEVLRARACG